MQISGKIIHFSISNLQFFLAGFPNGQNVTNPFISFSGHLLQFRFKNYRGLKKSTSGKILRGPLSFHDKMFQDLRESGRMEPLIFQERCDFIFIGGMQPKKVQIDDQPWPCPTCGLPSARRKRRDHYLSLFFIPLIPVKRGESFLECNRCGGVFDESGRPQADLFHPEASRRCPKCGEQLSSEFKYCPHCGHKIFGSI